MKKCVLTGVDFRPKRSNQIFINSKARNDYNNAKAMVIRKAKAKIDKPLAMNFKILSELMEGKNIGFFNMNYLLGKGLDATKFTHQQLVNGEPRPCYYDFLLTLEEGKEDNVKVSRLC